MKKCKEHTPYATGHGIECTKCRAIMLHWTVTAPLFGFAARKFEFPRDSKCE
jgi:hypothetical protein